MQIRIESRKLPLDEISARIREHRGTEKTIDSFLDACVAAAHELNLTYYFRVDQVSGWKIVAVFL